MLTGLFLITGFIGGIITALAGGAQFLIFPMLNIVGGLPARTANGTSSMAVWPSPLITGILLGKSTTLRKKALAVPIVISLIGSCCGVAIVSAMSDQQFKQLIPFLLATAAVALTWGQKVREHFKKPTISLESRWLYVVQFVIALYAGVYGGGVAIIMLAAYGFFTFRSLNETQQLKNLLVGLMNFAAAASFAVTGLVSWSFAVPLLIGNVVGGFVGAHLLKSLNPSIIKQIVIVFAWSITAYYFVLLCM